MHEGRGREPNDAIRSDESGDEVISEVAGVGARLRVTATEVTIVRDGSERRPRTGVRAWSVGSVHIRLDPPRHGTGRLTLSGGSGTEDVSLIVSRADWPDAERAVSRIRAMAGVARRSHRSTPPPAAKGRTGR
jgi:hypothetical protein